MTALLEIEAPGLDPTPDDDGHGVQGEPATPVIGHETAVASGLLTARELSDLLGVSKTTVDGWRREGKIEPSGTTKNSRNLDQYVYDRYEVAAYYRESERKRQERHANAEKKREAIQKAKTAKNLHRPVTAASILAGEELETGFQRVVVAAKSAGTLGPLSLWHKLDPETEWGCPEHRLGLITELTDEREGIDE